jgi:hypothetical protein
MKVAVFGLGYVGCVSAACLAHREHEVIGVDTNAQKVSMVHAGKAPLLEPGLAELMAAEAAAGRLDATTDAAEAVMRSEISVICVGTPSAANGSLSLDAVERVARSIGEALLRCERRHTVVLRSTALPGTTENVLLPLLEAASGLRAGADFGLATNPEFLREGTAVADFEDPPKTVIGELDAASGEAVAGLYDGLPAPVFRVPIRVAEMVKYVDNAFHATKIAFANEIGALSRAFDVDRLLVRAHENAAPVDDDTVVALDEEADLAGLEESGVLGVPGIVHQGHSHLRHPPTLLFLRVASMGPPFGGLVRSRTVPFAVAPIGAASFDHLAAKQVGGRSGFTLTSLVMQRREERSEPASHS